ncbi:Alpha/Beta hydrolase protein [Zopfochytrium polystomum]|nr:Alpha/Beta hydrolase protein [Zopfochytrium polystomum]
MSAEHDYDRLRRPRRHDSPRHCSQCRARGDYPHAVEAFLGIPYCLPPTGNRRFRPPVRVPDASPDTVNRRLALEQSEDSLTANVFRQAEATREGKTKLPVAIYIHGGAFNRASASMHNTTSFVGHSAAADGLRFVQLPRIGLATTYLNYDPETPPLFHRVVIESGAPTSRAVRLPNAPIHEQQFRDYLDALTARATSPTNKSSLQPQPALGLQPVIDGEIIRRRPIDAWRQGLWHKVPIMTGFNGNEGSLYEHRLHLGVGTQYKRVEAAYGHYAYVAPVRQTADFAAKAGVPVYLYHWALDSGPINRGAAREDNSV